MQYIKTKTSVFDPQELILLSYILFLFQNDRLLFLAVCEENVAEPDPQEAV
jgi:hypothetical protein